jgi:hypothetical protein
MHDILLSAKEHGEMGMSLSFGSYILVRQIEDQNYGKLTISWDNFILPSYCALKASQGVSYSQKFRVKRGFPNYLEVAISQFGSAKK